MSGKGSYRIFVNKPSGRKNGELNYRRVRVLCAEGKISGARKVGAYWPIFEDAEMLKDERIKSRKYKKTNVIIQKMRKLLWRK